MLREIIVDDRVRVWVSAIWKTTCTRIQSEKDTVLIDSPVLPEELEEVRTTLSRNGKGVKGLATTHGDYDHVFGPFAFPEAPLLATDTTIERLADETHLSWCHRSMALFDDMFYVDRAKHLRLDRLSPATTNALSTLAKTTVEVIPTDGHTNDGMALLIRDSRALVCGDYLSPVEIPKVRGSIDSYLATLDRLEPLVRDADVVIPGHGDPLTSREALAILIADRDYLTAVVAVGKDAPLPPDRNTPEQRRVHRVMNTAVDGAENWSMLPVEPDDENQPATVAQSD